MNRMSTSRRVQALKALVDSMSPRASMRVLDRRRSRFPPLGLDADHCAGARAAGICRS